MGDFYVSKQDANLARDIISVSTDLYIMPLKGSGSGVLDKSSPALAIITDAAATYVADELIGLIIILDGYEFVIIDNDITTVTIDLTSDVDGDDQSANLVDAATYDYRIWAAEEFIGFTDESAFNDEDIVKEFKTGSPKKKIREDTVEKITNLTTIIRTPGPGVLKSAYKLKDSSNVTYYILKGGSDPSSNPVYYLIAKNKNVNNKLQQLRMYYCQIRSNGERSLGGTDTDYENVPVIVSVNTDILRNADEDSYRIRIEK